QCVAAGLQAAHRSARLCVVSADGGAEPAAQVPRAGRAARPAGARSVKPERLPSGGVHEALAHDSAELHVAGEARYVDDLPEPPGTLYAALGMSSETHAEVRALDLEPVRRAPGVVAVVAARDIPGRNNIGPVLADEPVFPTERVELRGQPLFAVAAT